MLETSQDNGSMAFSSKKKAKAHLKFKCQYVLEKSSGGTSDITEYDGGIIIAFISFSEKYEDKYYHTYTVMRKEVY